MKLLLEPANIPMGVNSAELFPHFLTRRYTLKSAPHPCQLAFYMFIATHFGYDSCSVGHESRSGSIERER